jgi:hypothetical protein
MHVTNTTYYLAVDTSGHMYDDFIRLLFLHTNREASALVNELPILAKSSDMRISIPVARALCVLAVIR